MDELLKVSLFTGGFLLFQVIAYFGIEKFEGAPHDVKRSIDEKIPVVPWFSVIYATWFIAIAIFPVVIFFTDREVYETYMAAMFIDIIISCITYYIYPTSFTRPDTDSRMLKIVYFMSYRQVNCMPSLHCSMSYIIIISCIVCSGLDPFVKAIFLLDGILIPISTLYTKQHVVIDVVSAVPYAAVSWGIAILLGSRGLLVQVFSFL